VQSSHAASWLSASFSDPNLIASAGLVPVVRLAERCDLPVLIRRHVDLKVTNGANPAGSLRGRDRRDPPHRIHLEKPHLHATGRLIVRRVRHLNPATAPEGQSELFAAHRHHAFHTDSPLTITQAEPTHRGHAVIEQVFADLEDGPLAHLPSGKFNANAARPALAGIAYNLTRAAGTLASRFHAKATAATIRRTLINIPARIATSARRTRLHLPEYWP
jgi:hypothetical protein